MNTQKNTYLKLDRDSAKSRVDNTSMFDCRNMKLLGNKPNESGVRTNDYGNKLIVDNLPGYIHDIVIGSAQLRDYVILFSTDRYNASSTPSDSNTGRIWKVNFNVTTPIFTLLYSGALGFSTYWPINEIVTRYENDNVQKVYWTDGYHGLRFANVATYLTVSGAVYSSTNLYLDPDIFNMVNEVTFATPTFTKMTNGNLNVGVVQYAYRLYRKHGAETAFSPVSQLVHLTTKQEGVSSILYGGSDRNDENGNSLSSGKGVKMTITGLDTTFDKIEIVAIHYQAINESPTINVVDTFDVTTNLIFTDDGVYGKGSYTLAQFALLSSPLIVKTIATKNNILFAGNVKQSQFDITYDARAYRWTHASKGKYAQLWDKDGVGYYSNVYNADPTQNNKWTSYNMTPSQVLSSWSAIPETFDCINPHNNIATKPYYDSACFKYQRDYTTIGGEGPNIKYSFALVDYVVDSLGSTNKKTFLEPTAAEPAYYNSFASPLYAGRDKSFARDEIYRFGVVFYSLRGEVSPVHWIGDIRMPSHSDLGDFIDTSTTTVGSKAIKILFTLSNLPTDISGYQIVRVKREKADRSIIFQAQLHWLWRDETNIWYPIANNPGSLHRYMTNSKYSDFWMFAFSPEISFNKDFVQSSGDFLEVLGVFKENNKDTDSTTVFTTTKLSNFVSVAKSSNLNPIKPIATAKLLTAALTPDSDYENLTEESFTYRKLMLNYTADGSVYSRFGDLGTCVFMKIDTKFNFSSSAFPYSTTDQYYALVNYRRPVIQYGGANYEDRLNNEYIKASEFTKRTAASLSTYSTYGDVTIGYTDILTSSFNKTVNETTYSSGSDVMFPCESTINQSLRMDDCYHKVYESTPECFYLRETDNAEFTPDTTTYSPGWSDLYLYNTVYSKQPDIQKFFPLPSDYDFDSINDNIVMASNVKLNNEEIDSWTKFSILEAIEVNGDHGKVNYLRAWNNQLLYLQDNAVGVLAVLDRSMIQDSDGKKLTLAEGGILSRFDEIVTGVGCNTTNSLALSQNGAYWYDNKRKRFYRLQKGVENIGLVKGMNSYFDAISSIVGSTDNILRNYGSNPFAGFYMLSNPKANEIWFNIKTTYQTGETLVYDELNDNFSYFIDHDKALGFIKQDNIIVSQKLYSALYFEQSELANRGQLYDTYKDSYVELLIAPSPNIVCTFNGFEITTEILNSAGTHLHEEHLKSIRVQNDYQDTGTITLSATNIRRLLRTWRINAIRDSVSPYARIRDTYIKVRLSYTNNSNNYKVMLYDLLTLFSIPFEAITNKAQGNEK